MVHVNGWLCVLPMLLLSAFADNNATVEIAPPRVFPNNSSEIKVNETAREYFLHKEEGTVERVSNKTVNITTSAQEGAAKNAESNSTDISEIPLVFPANSSGLKDNATLRNHLLHHDTLPPIPPPIPKENTIAKQSSVETSPKLASAVKEVTTQPPPRLLLLSTTKVPKHNPKQDSEFIQQDGENSEDERHPLFMGKDVRSPQRDHGPGVPLVRGQLAAILAGIFVVLAVGGYIALLSWRRYLENRYGNREMLVNEEELNEGTDMRYFSVSKL